MCIFSGRTPAGMSVLGSYLGSMPPLPALVLTHLPSRGEIYQYPPSTPIMTPSVLQWLKRVEDGTESSAGKEERRDESITKILINMLRNPLSTNIIFNIIQSIFYFILCLSIILKVNQGLKTLVNLVLLQQLLWSSA